MTDPTPSSSALTLEQRIRALELETTTWYEKHLPLLAAIGGFIVGGLLGHVVRL